jgi:uncharacterized protein YcbX
MWLSSIHVYPVKGLRGYDVPEAVVEPWGLRGDRRFMLVDRDGGFLSQRGHPRLTQAFAGYRDDGALRLRSGATAGLPELVVPVPTDGELIPVTVWRSTLDAMLAADEAHRWLSKLLGAEARLVYLDDPTRRPVNPEHARDTDRVSFADGYPVLATTDGSLNQLNDWLLESGDVDEPLPMNRFRPSIVVGGVEPWAEDGWSLLRAGTVPFRVASMCGRCVVTTTDQDTGERERQPLRMLGQRRRFGTKLVFGQNLIPDVAAGGTARIAVGDPVTVS